MEQIIENIAPWHVRIAKWIGAWLLIQTLIMGTFAWFISYQILIRGANVQYWPAEDIEPVKKK